MPDTEEPTRWGRMVARMHGEVPAEVLEAYRRAGGEVYDLLEDLESRRLDMVLGSADAWAVAPATQAALLCGWNAFALQLLGDQLLAADYEADPPTVGYVPVVTARQAFEFYGQVAGWLERARRAESNPSFVLDVAVPAPLPAWAEVGPCPLPHLSAIRAAAAHLRRQAMAGAAGFHLDLTDPDRRKAHEQVHELLADAEAALDYADRLWSPDAPWAVHEDVERHSKVAISRLYLLGQILAMPHLALRPLPRAAALPAPAAGTLPGQPGFDPWRLTDPAGRVWWQHDPQARAAIQALWANDPQPTCTLTIQVEIEQAAARGEIGIALWRGGPLGHYSRCPWAPIYEVRRPTTIAGRVLHPLQHFSFDVSADEVVRGGPFRREIVVGPFQRNG